ncbi:hypothetical protein P811_04841 [Escherichia coli BIDMC 49b]|nr:hypothetical protein P811_04841 [Escherichia coli BIDMC 49b]ETY52227.1 hypothetical protein P810_04854 [Escherichia coli BIDMC 49a]
MFNCNTGTHNVLPLGQSFPHNISANVLNARYGSLMLPVIPLLFFQE